MGLILELTRNIGRENARMHAGEPLQKFVGMEIEGRTLGVIGLGKLGTRCRSWRRRFGMNVIAWSPNLTPEKCKEAGVDLRQQGRAVFDRRHRHHPCGAEPALARAGRRAELARMKPTAYLVNTARGPIVDEGALLEALTQKKIAGAGIDVFAVEPLPVDHPFRKLDNMVLTPHLGYVTGDSFPKPLPADGRGHRRLVQGRAEKLAAARRRQPHTKYAPVPLRDKAKPGMRIRTGKSGTVFYL